MLIFATLIAVRTPVCAASESVTLLRSATVIDVDSGKSSRRDLLLRGERIVEVRAPGELATPAAAAVIDAAGLYAIPGLWDMHLHLTAVPELDNHIFSLLIANGVTSVRDMGGRPEAILPVRAEAQRAAVAPRVFIAGPVIDGSPRVYDGSTRSVRSSSVAVDTTEEAHALVDRLAGVGVDMIKPYEMLRPEVFRALVDRAHTHGLPVTGHVPLRMTTPEALDAGLDGIEHLRGMEFDCAEDPAALLSQRVAMMDAHDVAGGGYGLRRSIHATVRPIALEHQDPERCTALIRRFAKLGTWHTPTLHFVAFRALEKHRDPAWVDAYRYLPPALRQQRLQLLEEFTDESKYLEWTAHGRWALDIVGQLHDSGVRILAGTDSPGFIFMPGFTLHDELEALVEAGLPPVAALQAATTAPARFFNMEHDIGSIEPGKLADFLLLSADPLTNIRNSREIVAVVSKGRVLDRGALEAMLAAVESRRQ